MPRQELPDKFDAIIIGSGMSGMAAASTLAQLRKWKVLVLEAHFTLGGFLHCFKRNGYEWDPGFHYVGDMAPGTQTRDCMDLVTGGQVDWQKLDEGYEQLMFPGETIELPSTPQAHKALLEKRFPDEVRGINQYFKDIFALRNWSSTWYYSKVWPRWMSRFLTIGSKQKLAQTVTQDYLDRHIKDPLLKAILTSQWGDYGTPPGRSALGVHALVAADFMNGGYYAIGGSQKIADSAKAVVESFGGHCVTRHKVTEILIENNKAVGVVAETKQGPRTFHAPRIISAAGLDTTFKKLVPSTHCQKERARLTDRAVGISSTILFLGLKDDPRKHGYKDANYWMFDKLNHSYEEDVGFPPLIGNTGLSFASLRNPALKKHVAQLVQFSAYSDWDEHQDTVWRRRGDDYKEKKQQYTDTLLDFVEERLPGFRDLIEYQELATPLTVEAMSGHIGGQVYGRESTPARIKENWNIHTSVRNLYVTGTDICVPGVNSALMMGVITASRFVRPHPFGLIRVLKHAASSQLTMASLFRSQETSQHAG